MRGTLKAPPAPSKPIMKVKTLRERVLPRAAILGAAALALLLMAPAGASALGSGEVEEFAGATVPSQVTSGPDGNVWFSDEGATKVGKVVASGLEKGKITEYGGLTSNPFSIDTAAGNIWFTEPEGGKIGVCEPANCEATVTEYAIEGGGIPVSAATGPDGNFWFMDALNNKIGKVVTSGPEKGKITEYGAGLEAGAELPGCPIAAGSDGNVWFGDCGPTRRIGKITTTGTITEYFLNPGEAAPKAMALNSDGNIWTSVTIGEKGIAKITPSGTISYVAAPTGSDFIYYSLTQGSDGYVWGANVANANEVQELVIEAEASLGGFVKLKFESCETGPVKITGTATEITNAIKNALNALSCIGSGTVSVSGTGNTSPIKRKITFGGKFARTNVPLIECKGSELTGTNPKCSVTTITEAKVQRMVRVKPNGSLTQFPLPASTLVYQLAQSGAVSNGPDGNLWFATTTGKIGTFGMPPTEKKLTLNIEEGEGTVVSSPAGLECTGASPTSCEADYETGKVVTLTASPAPGYLFKSWKGCDTGGVNGRQCKVTLSGDKTVGVKFVKSWNLAASKAGSGQGKLQSAPGGILCLYNCQSAAADFKEGSVTLTAAAAKHNHLVQWLGDCSGETSTCTLNMNEDHEAEAEFAPDTQYTLSLSKTGGGQASIKSSPSGLLCGYTCGSQSASFYSGETVSIAVTLNKGTTALEWTTSAGTCTGSALTCTVSMSAAKTLVAKLS